MLHNHLNRVFSSYGLNHFTIDKPLQAALEYARLDSSYFKRLTAFGEYAGKDLLEITDYIDKVARPKLRMWDVQGTRLDWVQIDPAHKQALEKLLDFGIVRAVYAESAPFQFHYAMGYLLADPGLYCTLTLGNQTAYALYKYGDQELQQKYLTRYLEADSRQAWHGATFYTETQGGSDLGANRAVAKPAGKRWTIDSPDKYFASNAGIADGALVTARPEGGQAGTRGIALFFVPAFREDGSTNYCIRRLKDKLGTRAVPTGEVELIASEAYLIGSVEHGIYQALEVLIVARLANAMAALGVARKAYLEALHFTQKRQAFGKPVIEHPLVQKDLLEMEVEIEANLLLTLTAIEKFDGVWHEPPPYSDEFHYARFLAHIAKNMTAEMSARVTQQAMELHGGVGFLEDFPVARWHREALITPIWEGTSNIQALDMLEVMAKKNAHQRLFDEIHTFLPTAKKGWVKEALGTQLLKLEKETTRTLKLDATDAQYHAKALLVSLGELAATRHLLEAGDRLAADKGDHRFVRIVEFYALKHLTQELWPVSHVKASRTIILIDQTVSS
ncbi:MAG: acyl-CoA dehydrogenase family protein [bacterium]